MPDEAKREAKRTSIGETATSALVRKAGLAHEELLHKEGPDREAAFAHLRSHKKGQLEQRRGALLQVDAVDGDVGLGFAEGTGSIGVRAMGPPIGIFQGRRKSYEQESHRRIVGSRAAALTVGEQRMGEVNASASKLYEKLGRRAQSRSPPPEAAMLDPCVAFLANHLHQLETDSGTDHTFVDRQLSRTIDSSMKVSKELDELFSTMGRHILEVRLGQRVPLHLVPHTLRSMEVKALKSGEDTNSWWFQVYTQVEPPPGSEEREAPQVGFDVFVSEGLRQVQGGPYRAQSAGKSKHTFRFRTDMSSVFLSFYAKQECYIKCACILAPVQASMGGARAASEQDTASASEHDASNDKSASVGRKLAAKLQQRRMELGLEEPVSAQQTLESPTAAAASSRGYEVAMPTAKSLPKRQLNLFDAPPPRSRSGEQIKTAQRTLLRMMFPWNKYLGVYKRSKPRWVKSLSAQSPQRLVKFLQSQVQHRQALTSIAIAGSFAFFLKRQRELHLMRSRTALRQLVWYKCLFAASRFRYMIVFAANARQAALARQGVGGQKRALPAPRERDRDETASEADSPSERVRKTVALFRRTGRRTDFVGLAKQQRHQSQVDRSPRGAQQPQQLQQQAEQQQRPQQQDIPEEPTGDDSEGGDGPDNSGTDEEEDAPALSSADVAHLAFQGFFARPMENAFYIRPPERNEEESTKSRGAASLRLRRKLLSRSLALRLQRDVRITGLLPEASDDNESASSATAADDAGPGDVAKAVQEVKRHMHVAQVQPEEAAALRGRKSIRVNQMGTMDFEKYQQRTAATEAEQLLSRRANMVRPEPTEGTPQIRIRKRYLLPFFDEEESSALAWLPVLQSTMLVIQSRAVFQTPRERTDFDAQLHHLKEVRRAALKQAGLFAPLEAALWSHPVILGLALRLQQAEIRGDGDAAWKVTIFENRFEVSSGRDVRGDCFASNVPVGGSSQQVLRRLADIGGPFVVATAMGNTAAEDAAAPYDPSFFATRTVSGHPIRAFGEQRGIDILQRSPDKAREIPTDAHPRDLRIETLRRRRRERDALLGPREGHPLIVDSDRKAQQRYNASMVNMEAPEEAREMREQMVPYLESLVHPSEPTFSAPAAVCKRLAKPSSAPQSGLAATGSTIAGAPSGTPASGHASAPSSRAPPATPRRTAAAGGAAAAAAAAAPSALGAAERPAAAQSSSPSPRSLRRSARQHTASIALPTTVEEIGALIAQSDALETILSLNASEQGSFAHRLPAGWISGYRQEPLSQEEIRRARITEDYSAPCRKLRSPFIRSARR